MRIGSLENESEDPNGPDSFRFDEKNRWYERNHREDSTSKFSLVYTDENIPVYSFYTISYKIDKTEFYYPNGVLRERIVLTYGPSGKATNCVSCNRCFCYSSTWSLYLESSSTYICPRGLRGISFFLMYPTVIISSQSRRTAQ